MTHQTLPFPGRAAAPHASTIYNSMLRVDHAGELGAVYIYKGQLAVLRRQKNQQHATRLVQRMAWQEEQHLRTMEQLTTQYGVRRSALQPLWRAAGFVLGAVTAAAGKNVAMACTAAVEDVIEQHYQEQIETLQQQHADSALVETLQKFRDEELEHRHTALEEGAEHAPTCVHAVIKAGCKAAIAVAKKI